MSFAHRHVRSRLVPVLLLPALVLVGALPLQPRASAQVRVESRQGADPMMRILVLEGSSLTITALDRPLRLLPDDVVIGSGQSARLEVQGSRLALIQGQNRRLLTVATSYWLRPLALRNVLGPAPEEQEPAASSEADFQLQQRRYRGQLQLLVGQGGLQAVNHIPLESYLPSVVGSEMPASWPQAALQAQAVAARSYALRQRKPSAAFDLSSTTSSQVYKGTESETSSTREAVSATRGQVLTFRGDLVNAVFHSSSSGSTENSGDVWSRQLPYLVSVPDFDASGPVSQWQQRLDPDQLQNAFRETGGATRIDIVDITGSGRIRRARVFGPAGTLVLTGPELRSRLRLRSTWVRFETLAPELAWLPLPPPLPGSDSDSPGLPGSEVAPLSLPRPALLAIGRGFGHGVGMSQWGAFSMAQQGSTYQQILSHYYRGTELSVFTAP
ncbi:MAG: SpoIID/LytB domain-containing protein [Cyanobacteriota bacterium]|nr:SpoIID/LytB domain-containing protein [Cyanobacteriota bacterium]